MLGWPRVQLICSKQLYEAKQGNMKEAREWFGTQLKAPFLGSNGKFKRRMKPSRHLDGDHLHRFSEMIKRKVRPGSQGYVAAVLCLETP